jgi:uncharacterized repeat protein (TIGR01451 family)
VGGAILASGTGLILFLEEVTLSTSAAVESGGGIGLLGSAAVTVRNSIISDNTADLSGGGIYVAAGSSLTLINTTVEGNTTQGDGGGIFNAGDLVVTGSSISGNEASGAGGALYNASTGEAGLVRSTLSGNTSSEGAGGITNLGELSLRSSTVTLNGSTDIGGAGGLQSFTPSTAQVANSIIAGNSGTSGDCSGGGIVSLGHNLQTEDASPCPFSEPGDIEIEKVQLFTQVLEEELKDNGGPTTTHALLARGLAVDAGYCPGETSDQRGFTRPVDDPVMANAVDGCDIGAHEVQGPVTPVADLMVSQSVNKTSVKQGELLTYFIRVQNLGPQTATAVVLSNILSSGVTFVEARHAKGTHTAPPKGETGTVTWFLGDLLNQANEVAEIEVTVLVKGKTTITNNASVTGDVNDPNTGNNSAAITVSVVAGTAGKGGKSR